MVIKDKFPASVENWLQKDLYFVRWLISSASLEQTQTVTEHKRSSFKLH